MSSTRVVLLAAVDEVDIESSPLVDVLDPVELLLSPVVCGTVVGAGVPNPDVSSRLPLQAHSRASAGSRGRCRGGIPARIAQAGRKLQSRAAGRGEVCRNALVMNYGVPAAGEGSTS